MAGYDCDDPVEDDGDLLAGRTWPATSLNLLEALAGELEVDDPALAALEGGPGRLHVRPGHERRAEPQAGRRPASGSPCGREHDLLVGDVLGRLHHAGERRQGRGRRRLRRCVGRRGGGGRGRGGRCRRGGGLRPEPASGRRCRPDLVVDVDALRGGRRGPAGRRGRGRPRRGGGRGGVVVVVDRHVLGRQGLEDGPEPQLGGLADDAEGLVAVLHAGEVDDDVVALPADLRLGHTERVDPVPDDVDRLARASRTRPWTPCLGASTTEIPPWRSRPSWGVVSVANTAISGTTTRAMTKISRMT